MAHKRSGIEGTGEGSTVRPDEDVPRRRRRRVRGDAATRPPAGAVGSIASLADHGYAATWGSKVDSPLPDRARGGVPGARMSRAALPVGMTAHWSWVMDEVLADPEVSHVSILADRTVFKPCDHSDLLARAPRAPTRRSPTSSTA